MKKQHYFIGLISTIGLMVLHCPAFASGVVDYLGPVDKNIHLSTLLILLVVVVGLVLFMVKKRASILIATVIVAALMFITFHVVQTKALSRFARNKIGTYATEYFSKHPEKLLSLLQQVQQTLSDEQFNGVKRTLTAHRHFLLNANALPLMGKPNAPMTVLFFFDFQCAYCHKQNPILQTLIHNQPDVNIVFVPLALFGNASQYANKMALYAKKHGKFADFYNALEKADLIEGRLSIAGVDKVASAVGLSPPLAQAAIKYGDFQRQLLQVKIIQHALGISGTPFLFLVPSDHKQLNLHTIRILRGFTSSKHLNAAINILRKDIHKGVPS